MYIVIHIYTHICVLVARLGLLSLGMFPTSGKVYWRCTFGRQGAGACNTAIPMLTCAADAHKNEAPGNDSRLCGNWVADMQVLLSEMQKSCSRCKVFASWAAKPACRPTIFTGRPAVFASRVAKPECRTTIFTGRPDRLLFYDFISIGFQAKVFASRVAKPECRTTIFTSRPAVFASRVAKPECRTTILTGRPDRLLFYYFIFIGFKAGFLHLGQHFLYVGSRFCMSAKRIPLS